TSDITSGTATSFSGSLSGDVTGTQSATAISASTVTGKLLTGFVSGAGTVAATDNILQAINKLSANDDLKANLTSPTFTGTPTAPTETAGNNTTALATTAFVTASVAAVTIQNAYPIGSIYLSTISTNPATSLGFGTWVAFGAGRVLLGSGSGYVAGDIGGSAHAAVVDHTHTFTGAALPAHNHQMYRSDNTYGGGGADMPIADPNTGNTANTLVTTASIAISAGTPSGVVGNTGLSGFNANLQPYIVVYIWNRTM
ncbi:MAG: hypothetical protein WCL21_16555, partial [Mariniphaga sp.]